MGGTCGKYPKSPSLSDLAGVSLQGRWEAPEGCCPNISGAQSGSGYDRCVNSRGFTWPKNGEFQWGGLGSNCYMCSDSSKGYGCSNPCGNGGATVSGKRPTVQRIAFKADPVFCCASKSATDGSSGTTCDPKYRDGAQSTACQEPLRQYCSQGSNLFDKTVCKEWAALATNTLAAQDIAKAYCTGSQASGERCLAWSRDPANAQAWREVLFRECGTPGSLSSSFCQEQLVKSGSGLVDGAVSVYCQQNPTSPFCSCLAPPDPAIKDPMLRSILSNQQCFSQTCINSGYKTAGQAAFKCPSEFNVCSNYSSATSGGTNTNTAQDCVINTYKKIYGASTSASDSVDVPATSTPATSTSASASDSDSKKNMLLTVLLVVLLIIGGGASAYLFFGSGSRSGARSASSSGSTRLEPISVSG